jgi:hypothetical protein
LVSSYLKLLERSFKLLFGAAMLREAEVPAFAVSAGRENRSSLFQVCVRIMSVHASALTAEPVRHAACAATSPLICCERTGREDVGSCGKRSFVHISRVRLAGSCFVPIVELLNCYLVFFGTQAKPDSKRKADGKADGKAAAAAADSAEAEVAAFTEVTLKHVTWAENCCREYVIQDSALATALVPYFVQLSRGRAEMKTLDNIAKDLQTVHGSAEGAGAPAVGS